MPEVDVRNFNNETVEKLALSDAVFGAKVNRALIWEAVRHYQANQRRGTASTKTRGEVSGSGKKLWRQKGTGRARIGSVRSPLWRHGGTVHGPKPRTYTYRFPRKKLQGAMRAILSARLTEDNLFIFADLTLAAAKTKAFRKILDTLGLKEKLLMVDAADNRNLSLSARNLPDVTFAPIDSVNLYDFVNHSQVVFSKQAILALQERLG
ncbi:MAG: 50S ribosomal protein L4 [Acidobacteria bacterium]|nr:50S ribosomal protein L4 [Acidobacteriota bacterium]MBI3657618.1 50S ribosomal protein L4 [Acidobacteriota bacterium]